MRKTTHEHNHHQGWHPIYCKEWGMGPVVTFSHGWPLNADAWGWPNALLSRSTPFARSRTIVVAMAGSAKSLLGTIWTAMPTILQPGMPSGLLPEHQECQRMRLTFPASPGVEHAHEEPETRIRISKISYGLSADSNLCVSVSWTGTKQCS